MQPLAIKFIELLESKQLLSDDVILELRRQVAESKVKLSPELLAKLLVDNGHLTKFQATKLVAELTAQKPDGAAHSTGPANAPSVEELGFAPATNSAEIVVDDVEEIVGVEPVEVIEDAVPIVEAAQVAEALPVEPASSFNFDSRPAPKSRSSKSSSTHKDVSIAGAGANPWDSFRILGVAVILGILGVVGFLLWNWMNSNKAEAALKEADELYERREYESSVGRYQIFATGWPSHEKASFARVRQVLSAIRKESEGSNPPAALKKAEEQLPVIVDEPSLPEQAADLAGALISLAEKFASRLDTTKPTDQRKELMVDMDKLMALINDSKYVGPTQRTQQAPTLLKIEESRARILREIRRDEELVLALQQIDSLLEAKDVIKSYEVRKDLLNRYPVLETNEEVVKRVRQASEIQRQLVKDVGSATKFISEAPAENVRPFMFAHRSGTPIADLEGQIVYYKVKGTVYAIKAATGEILWNKFVGLALDTHPIRLEESQNSDVLVAEAEAGKLHRLSGESGQSKWSVDFTEPIMTPSVEKEDVIVATYSGMLYNLDAVSGQTKWSKKMPQTLSVGPGVIPGRKQIYQPGDHSNVYVIDRQNGSCSEVFYLGHRSGSIKVPPSITQGILFIFENISNDQARIRILQPGNEGLSYAQDHIDMVGNIIAPPTADRTRLLVQTDLGQTKVLDVELNNSKNKVSTLASIAKNLDMPQYSWNTFGQNRVWIAEKRLAKYDLQVSTGVLKLDNSFFDGAQFIAPMQLLGKTLISARKQRGNQGVRIAAISTDATKESEIWRLDLGEPITMMIKAQSGFGAVTSSGNYYKVKGSPIVSEADLPSAESGMKWFANPIWISPTQAVLLNRSDATKFGFYSEGASPFRVLAVPLGTATPSCDGIVAGDKIVVGLDNGQLVMFDPATGSLVGPPYQPALKPNAKVRWNRPVYLPESRSIVIASDMNRIVRLDTKDSLRMLSDEALENNLVGPLALVGGAVAGVRSTGAADELVMFNSTSLAVGKGLALEGKLVAGPFSGQEFGLLQTNEKLVAFDTEGKVKWSTAFPNSQIVVQPTNTGDKLLISTRNGKIWNIDPNSGEIKGDANLGQPLSTAPLFDNGRIYLGTDEGAIMVVPSVPTTLSSSGVQQ
ncbi:MAG: PQQ-binding-like beta-propeller repeat protein [Pirellulales bacterium]